MRIKLTAAQLEMFTVDSKWTGSLEGQHWCVDDNQIDQFMIELRNQVEHANSLPYAEFSRQIFATRYLLTKVERMLSGEITPTKTTKTKKTADAPGVGIEVGSVVRLVGDMSQQFTVVKFNRDGSAQVYGGDAGHKSFRDFTVDRLTLHS